MRRGSRVLIAAFLLLPYLVFILRTQFFSLPSSSEVLSVLSFTVTQSALSAVVAMILGFWGSLGLIWAHTRFGEKTANKVIIILLLPTLVPALFLILSCFQIFRPFPFGFVGIVILHSIVNIGMVSVSFYLTLKNRYLRAIELAYVEGASLWYFLRRAGLRLFWPDFYSLFFYVFSLCLASFSIPLMAGKIGSTTLEVLIFEKIRIDGNLGEAVSLSLLQLLMLMALAFLVKLKSYSVEQRWSNLTLLAHGHGLIIPLACALISIVGLLMGLANGIKQISDYPLLIQGLPSLVLGSFFVSLGTGFVCLLGLLLIAYGLPHMTYRWFLFSFVAPSTALVGFSMFLLRVQFANLDYVFIILGLSILILPVLFRFRWANFIDGLSLQIETARTLGAGWNLIFFKLIYPQVIAEAGFLAGLAGLWASGDFAVSKIVSGRNLTLAMHINSMVSSYRINPAIAISWILIVVGGSVGMFFWGMGRVVSEESYS